MAPADRIPAAAVKPAGVDTTLTRGRLVTLAALALIVAIGFWPAPAFADPGSHDGKIVGYRDALWLDRNGLQIGCTIRLSSTDPYQDPAPHWLTIGYRYRLNATIDSRGEVLCNPRNIGRAVRYGVLANFGVMHVAFK